MFFEISFKLMLAVAYFGLVITEVAHVNRDTSPSNHEVRSNDDDKNS